ncbi:MAG: PAS domain-containing protein [Proteobacteria bacterium]|nr:PAS domain-containing protein [Pseudomonadota bacterium]NOG58934.1 PAS domain-containing protein [Pseudomonadota bacterium]
MRQQLSNKAESVKKESLEQAFQHFTEVSSSLTHFYEDLEQQVSLLSKELADTRTQKNREYEERERVSNRLANLLHALPGGVVVLDGLGIVQECNPAAIELLDTPLVGERWRDVVSRAFKPQWDDGHDITLHDGRYVNISTQSLGSEPGQILLITDVTETRLLQEQISGLKRMSAMGDMAAALAHQIRTPLSSALLYVSNISVNSIDDDRRKRFTKKTMSSLQHLEILVEEMLLFAKGGRLTARPENIDAVVSDFIEQQNNELENCNLQITFNNKIKDIQVNLSSEAFKSALQNLFNNACQAAGDVVNMSVDLESIQSSYVQLKITDDGPGIPDSVKSRIFEPFITSHVNGTGLGLAIVDTVIRAHKGTIKVEDAPESGTCFTICLPIYKTSNK